MTNEELITFLTNHFPTARVVQGTQYPEMIVATEDLHSIALQLRQLPEAAFDFLVCLSGVDYPEFLTIVYHIESTTLKHFLVLKVNTPDRTDPIIDTVSDVWPTAEFHEREAYDLLGIRFKDHPDLRRLFLDDNWGFPLRKDYIDDVHIVSR